ncbi:MAG TPA: acetylxylan esterase [Bacteroidales bacterium]|nr:acetylxylan esterase [Bacteroidales bacterium]
MEKRLLMLLAGIFTANFLFAQTSDDHYKKPLKQVLDEVQSRFDVTIRYSEELVADRWVTYADWRYRPDLEKTLNNILAPQDLIFVKEGDKKYKLKNYEYYRWTPEDGREQAEYLASLYEDAVSWEKRKDELKSCMWSALRLDHFPKWTDSAPVTSNKRKMDGYVIENFALETLPGVYVCASMYRPASLKRKVPVMLCPNGHFNEGRYHSQQQYKCAMLARLGIVAVSYDLFAWGESGLQFKQEYHRKSLAMTMQVLNTIRILDYLLTLPSTDPSRTGITGGSGGGSHSMLITALDDRIKISVPAVMLSCYMYGGCPCESGMPVHLCGNGTNNVELASMAAPRPQLIISDGKDWTANVPETEFPLVQRVYHFYGKSDQVKNVHFADEGHDYGLSKRIALYEFIALHMGLDINAIKDKHGAIDESKITIEDEKAMYVFGPNGEKLPANAIKSFEELEKVFESVAEQ